MKLLTKHSDYAIRALIVLARSKGCYVTAREIARQQDIPYQFLRRILHKLIKYKLVVSYEGAAGGFKINGDPRRISIVEVINVFQGNIQLSDCMFRKRLCSKRSRCILRSEIKKVEKIVERQLRGITLATLLKEEK